MKRFSDYIGSLRKFYTPELKLHFFYNTDEELVVDKIYEDNFTLIYIQQGDIKVISNGQTGALSKGDIFLSAPYEKFELFPTSKCKTIEFVMINFLPSLFFELDKKSKILRPFDVINTELPIVYKKGELVDIDLLFLMFNKINEEALPLEAFSSLLTLILFEICSIYDKTHQYIPAKFSNEYDLKIYTYIHSRALTNIKIKDVMDEFFVSDWYVNKVCKKFYGSNFSFMLKSCKMWAARGLVVNKRYKDFSTIATVCGYNDYSGFYKAYKDYFGLSPKDDVKYYEKHKHFYYKDN